MEAKQLAAWLCNLALQTAPTVTDWLQFIYQDDTTGEGEACQSPCWGVMAGECTQDGLISFTDASLRRQCGDVSPGERAAFFHLREAVETERTNYPEDCRGPGEFLSTCSS